MSAGHSLAKQNWLGRKMTALLGISILCLIRERSVFASAYPRNSRRLRDAGVLPVPTARQPLRDQSKKMPGGVKCPSACQLGISTILAQHRWHRRHAAASEGSCSSLFIDARTNRGYAGGHSRVDGRPARFPRSKFARFRRCSV